jgi:glutamate dehydrogenase (NADP+)
MSDDDYFSDFITGL